MIPRKNEIEEVIKVLESSEYEDSETMAKALIKKVGDLLSLRDTFGVGVAFAPAEHPFLVIGPCYDKRSAQKVVQEAQEAGLQALTGRLSGTGSIRPAEVRNALCECGHSVEMHPKANKCVVLPTCHCSGFVKGEKK